MFMLMLVIRVFRLVDRRFLGISDKKIVININYYNEFVTFLSAISMKIAICAYSFFTFS
ncbi:hypothetical protein MASR2M36_16340 [Providencia sp.]